MGPGPAYRLLMTFGQADDLVYEFATNSIATPGRLTQHLVEVCIETSDSFLTSRQGLSNPLPRNRDRAAVPFPRGSSGSASLRHAARLEHLASGTTRSHQER